MAETDGESRTDRLEQALAHEQHEERDEQGAQLLREQQVDDRITDALSGRANKKDDSP
ncbi:MAG TPA: hypothetical protein VGH11_03690 [Jatrophihabitans sp.]|jgi:hypothetical protein